MTGTLAALVINQVQFCVPGHDDLNTGAVLNRRAVFELNCRVTKSFDLGNLTTTGNSTTDVECPHGKLGTWFANRLGGNNTDCLPWVDPGTTRQIAAIARRAGAKNRFACQHGTNLDGFNIGFFDDEGHFLVKQRVCLEQCLAGGRLNDILCNSPTEDLF